MKQNFEHECFGISGCFVDTRVRASIQRCVLWLYNMYMHFIIVYLYGSTEVSETLQTVVLPESVVFCVLEFDKEWYSSIYIVCVWIPFVFHFYAFVGLLFIQQNRSKRRLSRCFPRLLSSFESAVLSTFYWSTVSVYYIIGKQDHFHFDIGVTPC